MISPELKAKYLPTIGIECHVQLKTKTKLFAAVGNDARDAAPNTLISHICLGMPGALPVLNQAAIELVARAAFALSTKPQNFSRFDRKHYFYPDLPKGYQISQFEQPLVVGGHVHTVVDGEKKCVRITRAHLEEDAGKNMHPAGADYSLVDLNRAGTPLLEIVSEPDIHSAVEAKTYARELYLLMKYADVSDADLYHGNMRFDVNVSVSDDPNKLGKRSEVKNLNSFKSVEAAVDYEIERQIELLEKGEQVLQETRGWDEAKQKTTSQRGKEEAHDYRYMPEPDIPPVVLDDSFIENVKSEMPSLPDDYRNAFREVDISANVSDILLESPAKAAFVKSILDDGGNEHAKRVSNWIVGSFEELSQGQAWLGGDRVTRENAIKLSDMVADGKLSSTAAKDIWIIMSIDGEDPEKIAEKRNLLQVSDESAIEKIVAEVIAENSQAAEDV
jgi:aspartyl-tRNA(Asn)/glutamyl-tRNA(Gln) amidotransferase subunit B